MLLCIVMTQAMQLVSYKKLQLLLAMCKYQVILHALCCRYENCEMRTVVICDGGGESGGLDPLWFPGGHKITPIDFGSDT